MNKGNVVDIPAPKARHEIEDTSVRFIKLIGTLERKSYNFLIRDMPSGELIKICTTAEDTMRTVAAHVNVGNQSCQLEMFRTLGSPGGRFDVSQTSLQFFPQTGTDGQHLTPEGETLEDIVYPAMGYGDST